MVSQTSIPHVNSPSASISVTTTSARTAYPAGNYMAVTVLNEGAVPIFLASGGSTVAATTSGNFVGAGETRTFERNPNDTHLAAITASSTATARFNNGY